LAKVKVIPVTEEIAILPCHGPIFIRDNFLIVLMQLRESTLPVITILLDVGLLLLLLCNR
jgi:hypothetical protein